MEQTIKEPEQELKECRQEKERLSRENEELRLRLMFFEGIANSTFDGFLVVDTRGQKILQTQRTIDLWEIPDEVVQDQSGAKQVAHVMNMTADPRKFVEEINYQRDHPEEKRLDEIELVNGTVLERYSSPVIGPDGTHYGRIYTFHDITKRKNYEKQLSQLNADKDRFISILAHDLRSPFQNLLGFTEILLRQYRTLKEDDLNMIVSTLHATSRKTLMLLEDTLLWASTTNRKLVFSPSDINLSDLVREVVDILEPIAAVKEIKLTNRSPDTLQAHADKYMFKAILRNLMSNAIKFSNTGGTISVAMAEAENNITVSVTDNGIGIKKNIAETLFSFSSVQTTTGTSGETGSGLGLMLCKSFVEQHGGKIWVNSEENRGTTVSFTIPLKAPS